MAMMDLGTYQKQHGLSVSDLELLIGVSHSALHRYMYLGRIPEVAVLRRILAVTDGQVTPNDFFDGVPVCKRRVAA